MKNSCHIAGVGTAAAARQGVEQLAAIGAEVKELRAKIGMEARRAPVHDVAPFQLAVDAARAALSDADVQPKDVDLVVQASRMRFDYFTWGLSLALANELGQPSVRCLDVTEYTGPSLVAGLRLLAAKFAFNDRINTALLVFPHRFSDLVDVRNTSDQWLWPMSDGAGALVVRRGAGAGTPLGYAAASDGTAGRAIGLRTEVVDEGPDPDGFFDHEWALATYCFVRDPARWPAAFNDLTVERLTQVIRLAAARAELEVADLARVQTGFLAPQVADQLREGLDLGDRLTTHNDDGFMGGAELAFALPNLTADPALRDRPVILAGFGLPASFAAIALAL